MSVEVSQLPRLSTFLPDKYPAQLLGSKLTKYQLKLKLNLLLLRKYTSRAPLDCVQYFTGKAGSVQSYNFAGGQLIQSLRYTNCIRTEAGYCAIQWKESSTTSPDPFEFGVSPPAAVWTTAAAGGASTTLCEQYVLIPGLSPDGTTKIPAPPGVQAFQSQMCGEFFGLEHAIASEGVISMALVCK